MTKKTRKRKTVGAIATELQQKPLEMVNVVDLQRDALSEYLPNVLKCVQDNMHKYVNDFFVVVITKNEKLLHNVMRLYYFDRASCPTPDYDQTVFQVTNKHEDLIHLWTIPNREACFIYSENRDKVEPDEYEILDNILRFFNGDLIRLCKKLNHEEIDSNLIVT